MTPGPQIIWDVLLSAIYKVEHTIDIFPKMPAEKTRKLSIVFLFTLIKTGFEVVCTVCGCCSHSKKCKVPIRVGAIESHC